MDEPGNGGSAAGLGRGRRILVLAICTLSLLIVGLDTTIVNVALPAIRSSLHASVSGLQWTIDAYTLVLASLLMLAGSTADRIGRKRGTGFRRRHPRGLVDLRRPRPAVAGARRADHHPVGGTHRPGDRRALP
jgi:MFS transporter